MDSNATKQSVCGFCIRKKNRVMIGTIAGAKPTEIIYSIAERAKANNLKLYDYFEHLLTGIPKYLDNIGCGVLDDMCAWSLSFPTNGRKRGKDEVK